MHIIMKKNKINLLGLVTSLWLITATGYAQVTKVTRLTAKPELYTKAEFAVELESSWKNPYLQEDIALDMVLTSPSGKTLKLPAYYENGNSGQVSHWMARFAPQEKGQYTYRFALSKEGKTVSRSAAGSFRVVSSGKSGFLHGRDNWAFRFDNGKAFRGVGENLCWESRANDDSRYFKALHEQPKYNYEYMLRSLARHGGNYYRTWISNFNLPLDWHRNFNSNRYEPSDAYYNPSAIRKIDRMFDLADSLHLYVMLTLGPGNYSTRDGGFSPTAADFFVNPLSRARYKNRLRYFVARWGYSTSVGAWEFFNEVDNVQYGNRNKPISADSIVTWHDEMSRYLKEIDPYKHLVTTSISHRDLKGLNSLPAIDFNQKHIYKATASIPRNIVSYEEKFGKPYVIGEYSYEWDWSKNFDDYGAEMDSDFKRGLWYGLFSPTPVLPLSWWWEYFDNRGTDAYLHRVSRMSERMLAAGQGHFQSIPLQQADTSVISYAVKCGSQTFVYLFNTSKVEKSVNAQLAKPLAARKAQVYHCEADRIEAIKVNDVLSGKEVLSYRLAPQTDAIIILSESVPAGGKS